MNPHAEHSTVVIQALGSRLTGLTMQEAEERFGETGPNTLPETQRVSVFLLLLTQFKSVVIYILFGAAALSALTGHWVDVSVILAVIFINVVIGFFQTYRAEKAIESLATLVIKRAKVVRGGYLREIPASLVVPGDIIFLENGDRIPADARVIESKNFSADESSFTGESLPSEKSIPPVSVDAPLADRTNMVWMSTIATEGELKAIVVATGPHTELGKIVKAVREIKRPKTHFEKKTEELIKIVVVIASLGSLGTFFIGFVVRGLDLFTMFLFSIASLVAGIPEGLPAALTIVLAVGSRRMAKRRAIVRRLPAVETLGAVDTILTDKTGTLTQGKMEALRIVLNDEEIVVEPNTAKVLEGLFLKNGEQIIPLEDRRLDKLLHIAILTNNAEIIRDGKITFFGPPTDIALLLLGARAGLSKELLSTKEQELDELPFNQETKIRVLLIERPSLQPSAEQVRELYIAGAFEHVIERSSMVLTLDDAHPFTDEIKGHFLSRAELLMKDGYRLIGIASRRMPSGKTKIEEADIADLTFLGIIGLWDPLRPEVPEAIEKARRAGIRVIMVTGDHPTTALAIAHSVGLVLPQETDPERILLTENKISAMNDEELTEKLRGGISIFARVTPLTKLRITKLLQKDKHLVAVTGDGTNDAPALKQADIGIAMGERGTDVARESAEIILTNDNFASIVAAIEEGRVVFANIKQVSFYLLSTNVAEDITIISALGLGLGLPLLPIHVLWLNLVTDGVMTAPLALEPGHTHLLEEPARSHERIISFEIIPILLITGILMAVGTLILYQNVGGGSLHPEHARAVAFSTMAFFQLFNALNLRSLRKSFFSLHPFSNPWLILGIILSIILQVIVIQIPFFSQNIFRFDPLKLSEWLIIVLVSSSIFPAIELYKFIRYRKKN